MARISRLRRGKDKKVKSCLALLFLASCSCGTPRKAARAESPVVNLKVTPRVKMADEELMGCFYAKAEDKLYCMTMEEFVLFIQAIRAQQDE